MDVEMPTPAPWWELPAEKSLGENFAQAMKNIVTMHWLYGSFQKWLSNSHVPMIGKWD